MATDSDINTALLDDIYAIYSQAETEMLDKVAKRVAKGIKTEGWNERKLVEVQELRKDIQKTIEGKLYKAQGLVSEDIISAYTKGKISATIDAGKKAKGTSSIDMSGITSKKLKESIQTAFDFAKGMEGLPQDPDNMFKKVIYADGATEKYMMKTNAGAMVKGDTIIICKPFQKNIDDEFIMHEIGHKVTKFGSKTTDASQKKQAEELAKKLGYKDVKDMSLWVSDYAAKNPTELYPEVLMLYYNSLKTGKPLTGQKKKIVEAAMEQMYNDPAKKKKVHEETIKFAKGINTTILDDLDIPMNLKQLILATNGLLKNATFQVLRNAEDAYTKIMANATTGLLAGTDTRIQASQKMLNEMAAKGITSFVDKAGRNWSLSAYAEMCARTVSAHAALQGHLERQQELGEDLVKVSSIGTTCPICQRWQGVVLSISGQSPKYKSLESAREDGLFHPNCKHTIGMHIPELDGEGKTELNPVDPQGQTYQRNKLIEQQRANERKIRYWKDRAALAITPEEKAKALDKVKYWQQTNLLHCAKNDLRRQYAREKTYVGNANGPTGAPIGGSLKEFQDLYKEVIGANPKEAYDASQKLYGMKEVTFDKWLKDEILSLDQLDIDKAQMKDANNKAVTPTSLYKKYIGDAPMQDYAAVSPYEKGTKEFKSSYAKWLKQQIDEIGVSYKVKPKYVEVHEDIPEEDKQLSATNIYKKYFNKAPTEAYKELGGEAGTGMKYGKWVETQKKELIKDGITKTVPFENVKTQKVADTVVQATKVVDDAKQSLNQVKIDEYKKKLDDTVHGMYDGTLAVMDALKEFNAESSFLNEDKLKLAKTKHLEMVKKKAEKSFDLPGFEKDLNKLKILYANEKDQIMKAHIKDQINEFEKVQKANDPLAKYDKVAEWKLNSIMSKADAAHNKGLDWAMDDLKSDLEYNEKLLASHTHSWEHYKEVKQQVEALKEAVEGTLGMTEKEKAEFLKKKKEEEKRLKSQSGLATKVTVGREQRFDEGVLVRREQIYQNLSNDDLDKMSNQVPGHNLFSESRRDVLGRDINGRNHHMGHDVRLKSGLTPEQEKLGKAFQTAYNDYFNTIKCQDINLAYLRGYDKATPTMKKKIDDIRTAIHSVELNEPVVLHRFVTPEIMEAIFKTDDLSSLNMGSVYDNDTFMSAAVGGHPTFGKRNHKLTIQVDKGTHALPTLNHEEGEFLLDKGKLEVVGIKKHSKSNPQKLQNYDGSYTEFIGDEVIVRYVEDRKASEYETVTADKIKDMFVNQKNVSAHTNESKDWIKSLSKDEKAANKAYTGPWYSEMNDVYRRNDRSSKKVTKWSEDLTASMRRVSTNQPVVLRRGVNERDLAHMLGFNGDFDQVVKHWDEINGGGYAAEDKGFLSTSPIIGGGFSKRVELRIYCPTGSRAAYVDSISSHKGEQETLLQSGSMYRIHRLEKEKDSWVGEKTVAYLELLGTD